VRVGTIRDESYDRACSDGFEVGDVRTSVTAADVVLLLVPDEVMGEVFAGEVQPALRSGACLDVASGYGLAFQQLVPPPDVDVVMVAPRMIGPGVREAFVAGRGFPSFVAVHQDATGRARARMLALAKGIGSTRAGCLELSAVDEAALDLFNEQGFGPAFGVVLMSAIETLVEAGFAPAAVLLELYLSGELAYTLERFVRDGIVEQMDQHSHTSQYGSMTRGARFASLDLKPRMKKVLEEIRSGAFAREWSEERRQGLPTLKRLQEMRQHLPIRAWERQARAAFDTLR
jgi:ketol-acid reductoisomerase